MPYVKVWLHIVWSTKNRFPYLTPEIRPQVFQHLRDNATDKGIFLDFVSGYQEHVHCLVSLGTEQTISEIVRLMKGESSHWINQNGLTKAKFSWQSDYFCVGVSESMLGRTRDYIRNQEIHHSRRRFEDEFELMLKKYGFQRFEDSDC
jgi:REP element-mobilizing transposase RayT